MKVKSLIIIAVAFLIIIGGITAGAVVINSPENVAARSLKSVVENVFERDEIHPFYQLLTGGSVEASIENVTEDGEDLLEGGKISGKVYFSEDALMVTDFNADLFGLELVGDAYVSQDTVYISEEKILDGAYGINFSKLADQLADSIFAPDSATDYALDKEVFDKIIEALDSMEDNKKLEKDIIKLSKRITKDLWDIIVDNADITTEHTTTRLNGEKTKVKLTILTWDADALADIIADTYDYLCGSKDIPDFIEKHEDALIAAIGDAYDKDDHDSLVELYEEWLEDSEEYVDMMCDELDDEIDGDLSVEIATPKLNSKLQKLEVKVDGSTVFSLDCGSKGIENTDTVKIEVGGLKIDYEITADTRKELSAKITIEFSDYEQTELSFEIDKEKETYTAAYTSYYNSVAYGYSYTDSCTIKGNLSTKGSKTTVTVDKIIFESESESQSNYPYHHKSETTLELDCTIVVDTKDKMPSPMKDYKTIADITEKDMDAWLDKLYEIF